MVEMLGLFTDTSLVELLLLLATFVLTSLIGIERQVRQKSRLPDPRARGLGLVRVHAHLGLRIRLRARPGRDAGSVPDSRADRQRHRLPRCRCHLQGPRRRPWAHDGRDHLGGGRGGDGLRGGNGLPGRGADRIPPHYAFPGGPRGPENPLGGPEPGPPHHLRRRPGRAAAAARSRHHMGFSSSILRTRRTGDEQKPMVSMDVRFFGHHPLRNLVPHLMDLHGVESVIVRGTDSNEDDDDAA